MKAAELTVEISTVKEQIRNVRRDLDDIKAELRVAETLIEQLRNDNTALKTELAGHVKQTEKWDNRVWALIGLFVGSVLSLAGSLIVNAVRK